MTNYPLVHVDLNLTQSCNLSCRHCHSSSGKRIPNELTTEDLTGLIEDLHFLGVMRLAIAGGEPFLRSDIYQILETAAGLPGWQVSVITNGLAFRKDYVGQLNRLPNVDLNISLEAPTPSEYFMLRKQRGNPKPQLFDRLVATLQELQEEGIAYSVNTTLTAHSFANLPQFYRFAEGLGATAVVAIKFFQAGNGLSNLQDLDLSWSQWEESFANLTNRKLDGDFERLQISVAAPWEFYLPLIQHGIDIPTAEQAWGYRTPLLTKLLPADRFGDNAGQTELCIDADGVAYPSVLVAGDKAWSAGDLHTADISRIWTESSLLTSLRAASSKNIRVCNECPILDLCGGGSRVRATSGLHVNSATNVEPDPYCPIVRARKVASLR